MRYSFVGLLVLLCSFMSNAQATLRGTVVNDGKKPIPNAQINISAASIAVITDTAGYFEIPNLNPGAYEISTYASGYAEKKESRQLYEGFNTIEILLTEIEVKTFTLLEEYIYQPVEIVSIVATNSSQPFAFTNLSENQIAKMNTGQDVPYLLSQTASLVATSDAGNGIGYTGLWIRGSDPSRINVTINDIPLNDPESQQVFWVNTPDLASNTNSIQVQRGIGTSTNGAGAFGGSIKMNTLGLSGKPFFSTEQTFGSFGTLRSNVNFGSGALSNHFFLEGRLSRIQSDGYIDRAKTDLQSYYLDAAYKNEKTTLQLTTFSGKEITYQSWYGTPAEKLEGGAFADRNGLSDEERQNLINSGRTYNYYTYDNQVDNYAQTHYQLHLNREINARWRFNAKGHYTKGKGYFEEYKPNDDLTAYGLPIFIMGSDTVYTSNIVRQRWLDNDFFGGMAHLIYTGNKLKMHTNAAWNEYKGRHFGELIWAQYAPESFIGDRYYEGTSNKKDINFFTNVEYSIGQFNLFGDLQIRNVIYQTKGIDNDLRPYDVNDNLLFINPKAGVNFMRRGFRYYASVALGNKEPNRNDYVDAYYNTTPKSEQMIDYEFGVQSPWRRYQYGVNFYYMDYTNQLVLTGALNDVGAPLRANVADSYRAGMEISTTIIPITDLTIKANLTLSQNKIKSFNEVIYDYSVIFEEKQIEHTNTSIAFSPSAIANGSIDYVIYNDMRNMNSQGNKISATLLGRYVGKQYLDNTQNEDLIIEAYQVLDAKITYERTPPSKPAIMIAFWVNNVLDYEYSSNGYTYSYIYGDRVSERFYYPQAGRNFMASVKLSF